MADFNVLTFGAKSESPDNTHAFQKAIDAAAEEGTGRVVVPPGDYNLDMVSLRDNVELHLERGSRINGIMQAIPNPDSKTPLSFIQLLTSWPSMYSQMPRCDCGSSPIVGSSRNST